PTLTLHDATEPLPLSDASVDLLSMAAVLYTFRDPFTFLDDVRRVLKPGGYFLLYDWVRVPMADYISQREAEPGDDPPDRYPRALEMFASHNKYTLDDWLWVLEQGRFEIIADAAPHVRGHVWLLRPA
ncbi:MAG: methyltransferase domain-containing protein, partial [Dehalococcoidia bacterium]